MSESEIQDQLQLLYETESLRDELDDEAAGVLLKWGEEQIYRLAQSGEDFNIQGASLRQLIKRINRFIGQRCYTDESEQIALFDRVAASARELGYKIAAQDLMSALSSEPQQLADLQSILSHFSVVEERPVAPVAGSHTPAGDSDETIPAQPDASSRQGAKGIRDWFRRWIAR